MFSTMLSFVSCSTMKQNINKNNKSMDKLTSTLLDNNGNSFHITSSYATGSVVWTYNGKWNRNL